ncbi:MAG: hypothetical protein IMZ53_00245 [Thermoplasmata archaeon]|nr:hypothetical protein [Thermoplasmata archaeon]MBE3138992.1 hypothetical protein [Thermoplasmata archaeon]
MKKWFVAGISLFAVVLLVLGSLSNVVGYQSVKSTAVNESPLFITRTQKAINQQQYIITSQYLGMGKGNLLQFPIRDNRTESLKRVIVLISKMDDKTFERFKELCIQRIRQDKTISDTKPNEIIQMLQLLRTKPETITHSFISRNNYNLTSNDLITICIWFPGCIPFFIIWSIVFIIAMVYLSITLQISCYFTCQGPSFCHGSRCMNT